DRLRKHCGVARARDAMQSFVPSLIVRNAESRNRRRPVLQLIHLFLQSHASDKVVRTLLRRKMGIEVSGLLGRSQSGEKCKHDRQPKKAPKGHEIVPPEA